MAHADGTGSSAIFWKMICPNRAPSAALKASVNEGDHLDVHPGDEVPAFALLKIRPRTSSRPRTESRSSPKSCKHVGSEQVDLVVGAVEDDVDDSVRVDPVIHAGGIAHPASSSRPRRRRPGLRRCTWSQGRATRSPAPSRAAASGSIGLPKRRPGGRARSRRR